MSSDAKAKKPGRGLSPLWVISLFVTLTETVLGVAATQTSGGVQIALTAFAITFAILITAAFFSVLWFRPFAFYPPSEYGSVGVREYVEALKGEPPEKVITNTDDAKEKATVFGNPDRFRLLFKIESRAWSKSTKAMQVGDGCVVQVSTRQLTPAGWRIAEALSYVPGVTIYDEPEGEGRFLAPPAFDEGDGR